MVWVPIAQAPFRVSSVALRVAPGSEGAIAHRAEEVLSETAPQVMVRKVTTLAAQVDDTTSRERVLLQLASGFGALEALVVRSAADVPREVVGRFVGWNAPMHFFHAVTLTVALGALLSVPLAALRQKG